MIYLIQPSTSPKEDFVYLYRRVVNNNVNKENVGCQKGSAYFYYIEIIGFALYHQVVCDH